MRFAANLNTRAAASESESAIDDRSSYFHGTYHREHVSLLKQVCLAFNKYKFAG